MKTVLSIAEHMVRLHKTHERALTWAREHEGANIMDGNHAVREFWRDVALEIERMIKESKNAVR